MTLLSHTPAAPLTGHLRENMDKLFLNPQNTFTKDYQTSLNSSVIYVLGKKTVGPLLCGQNRFKIVPPDSEAQQLSLRRTREAEGESSGSLKEMKSSSDVRTGVSASPNVCNLNSAI